MSTPAPIRILHVLGQLNPGGVENWLRDVLRRLDRAAFRSDVLVHAASPGAYDDEVKGQGARLFSCPHPQTPSYRRRFRDLLARHGPFDVVHSHVHHFSGVVCRLAYQLGVPGRIVHSHTANTVGTRRLARRAYEWVMCRRIADYATFGLATSGAADRALFRGAAARVPRKILPCGIDLRPFEPETDRSEVRRELGLPPHSFVVGHVGRFVPEKNHAFLLRVAAELAARRPETRLVLVGDGPLRGATEREATRLIPGRAHFLGRQADVPRLLGAMDAFVFPSRVEGLGLALVEAQAAGVPCVAAESVPAEAVAIGRLVRRLPLSEPPAAWADVLLHLADAPRLARREALDAIGRGPLSLEVNLDWLAEVYRREGRPGVAEVHWPAPNRHRAGVPADVAEFSGRDCVAGGRRRW